MIPLEDITRIKSALEKATEAPWSFRELRGDDGLGYIEADNHDIIHAGVSDLSPDENRANAELICLLRNHAPALLSELIELRSFAEDVASGRLFGQQRFAEDDDAEYFLRCQRTAAKRARDLLSPEGQSHAT